MPCGSIHRRLASLVLNCYFVSGKINYRVSVIIDRYSMLVPIEFGVLWPRRQFWGYFLVFFIFVHESDVLTADEETSSGHAGRAHIFNIV